MEEQQDYLNDLQEIRSLMERSSRFISLSGFSGVMAGIYALGGAAAAYYVLDQQELLIRMRRIETMEFSVVGQLVVIFLVVLMLALATGIVLTTRRSRRLGHKAWNRASQRMIANMLIPLGAGGIFVLALLWHNVIGLIPSATLLFYGLGLINGSKYTLHDIRYLGIAELALGIMSAFFIGYGLLFWAVGFGLLHIAYGCIMYFKYER